MSQTSVPRYEPMLATSWPSRFEDAAWVHEVKWDGVRILLDWDGERVRLRSRRGLDVTTTYPELARFELDRSCVLDGEVVALDDRQRPSFERLQARMNVARPTSDAIAATPISMVVFDVLHHGNPVIEEPWSTRRDILERFELPAPFVVTDTFEGDPGPLWDFVVERDLEGIVSKRKSAVYRPGQRSADWRKVANRKIVKAVVCGYTVGDGGRSATFGSLVLCMRSAGEWTWVGAVGSGLDDASLKAIKSSLDQMRVEHPVVRHRDLPKGITWVEPQLVAVVEFKEWTSAGRFRAPVFKGFASDDPSSIRLESEH